MNKSSVDKELIGKIRGLRQIQPSKDWVSLAKRDILGQEPGISFFTYFKPVFAGLVAVFIFFGFFVSVKNSLPGDVLYSVRKAVHQGRAIFASEEEKPAFQLKLANDRLEDLTKAPVKNLAPTISEFQANIFEAARNLSKIDATTSDSVAIQKIAEETRKLEENRQKVEALGVVVEGEETEEFEHALAGIVGRLIKDLENRTLAEEKAEILSQMKELSERGQYSEALELYLTSQ
ncbi:MAG: hypothetical protein ABIG08_02895 [bacterium]